MMFLYENIEHNEALHSTNSRLLTNTYYSKSENRTEQNLIPFFLVVFAILRISHRVNNKLNRSCLCTEFLIFTFQTHKDFRSLITKHILCYENMFIVCKVNSTCGLIKMSMLCFYLSLINYRPL